MERCDRSDMERSIGFHREGYPPPGTRWGFKGVPMELVGEVPCYSNIMYIEPRTEPKYIAFDPLEGEGCPDCYNTGSQWARKKNGEYDKRYRHPVGPCPACKGKGVRNPLDGTAD